MPPVAGSAAARPVTATEAASITTQTRTLTSTGGRIP